LGARYVQFCEDAVAGCAGAAGDGEEEPCGFCAWERHWDVWWRERVCEGGEVGARSAGLLGVVSDLRELSQAQCGKVMGHGDLGVVMDVL
jgi:hypothetical protein